MIPIFLLLLLSTIFLQSNAEIDPKGYIIFCPCMGRFGNQVDQTLGVMQFARSLDRTLVLPNYIEFKHPETHMVPFEHLFQVAAIRKFHRVVTMSEFTKDIMPVIWPKEERRALCWSPRNSIFDSTLPPSCNAKEGSPFGPYWEKIGVDFVADEYFGSIPGAYDLEVAGSRKAWMEKFNSTTHPVLAFSSAPAHFPSKKKVWELQRYLRWGSRVLGKAKQFITDEMTKPFVGVHLRNDADWARVCEHISADSNKPIFASAQCLGELHHAGVLSKEMCDPTKRVILDNIVTEVGRTGAKSVFVASDKNHMIDEINEALAPYDVKAVRLSVEDPYVSLAILGLSDHFIGNCVSTFSHIVSRERESANNRRPTTFFGQTIEKKRMEL